MQVRNYFFLAFSFQRRGTMSIFIQHKEKLSLSIGMTTRARGTTDRLGHQEIRKQQEDGQPFVPATPRKERVLSCRSTSPSARYYSWSSSASITAYYSCWIATCCIHPPLCGRYGRGREKVGCQDVEGRYCWCGHLCGRGVRVCNVQWDLCRCHQFWEDFYKKREKKKWINPLV